MDFFFNLLSLSLSSNTESIQNLPVTFLKKNKTFLQSKTDLD